MPSYTSSLIVLNIIFMWTETKSILVIKNNNDGRKKNDIAKPYKISDSKKFVPIYIYTGFDMFIIEWVSYKCFSLKKRTSCYTYQYKIHQRQSLPLIMLPWIIFLSCISFFFVVQHLMYILDLWKSNISIL